MIRFIGDIHGDFAFHKRITENCEHPSVQLGDFGLGFGLPEPEPWNIKHRFIRGNHDNTESCKKHPNWIQDGSFKNKILYIGGAASIDRAYRTPFVNWWPDEELSLSEINNIVDNAINNLYPHTIVSHDVPFSVIPHLFPNALPFSSQTQNGLDYLFNNCKSIRRWIFGHWHENLDRTYKGVRFTCIGINQYRDIEL